MLNYAASVPRDGADSHGPSELISTRQSKAEVLHFQARKRRPIREEGGEGSCGHQEQLYIHPLPHSFIEWYSRQLVQHSEQ